MKIVRATLDHLDILTPLFDGYIVFYKGQSNPDKYASYLKERLMKNEAVIFLALNNDGVGMGFTLLYPSFSSVSQARIFVLNDLYVHPAYRKQGVATGLMTIAGDYAKSHGAIRLHLETEESNLMAQKLYEKEGWVKERGYFHYNLSLTDD